MRSIGTLLSLMIWPIFLFSQESGGEEPAAIKTIQAQRIQTSQIILDGRLEEAFWAENPGSSGVTPYFSRRIGLDSGNPVPISYGGRILGHFDPAVGFNGAV